MLEDLQKIDTAEVDALVEIRKEQRFLEGLVEKANASRGKVPEAVFERVMKDYAARRRAAEEQAGPLRQRARASLATLSALHSRLKAELETAQLDESEVQFRHEIGELNDVDYERRRAAAAETLAARKADFAGADSLMQRFLDVLPAGSEAAPPAMSTLTRLHPPVPARDPVTIAAELPDLSAPAPDSATVVFTRKEAAAAAGAGSEFETLVAPTASLVREQEDGSLGPSYRLGLVATIGRTPENEIPVELPEVSRKHARLMYADGSFSLRDLNSNNGTYVNGERVSEARLEEGDRIQVGPAVFVFSQS
jgi:hypothetical protein